VSYRLDAALKARLAERATAEGISETTLVARLLDEGLKTTTYPGVVYRGGPAGRRAALAGGPDVWEVIGAIRHAEGSGEQKVTEAAEQLGLPERLIRLALSFASAFPEEIETTLAANEQATEQARRLARSRARLLAS
jgi:hypothetical protein